MFSGIPVLEAPFGCQNWLNIPDDVRGLIIYIQHRRKHPGLCWQCPKVCGRGVVGGPPLAQALLTLIKMSLLGLVNESTNGRSIFLVTGYHLALISSLGTDLFMALLSSHSSLISLYSLCMEFITY